MTLSLHDLLSHLEGGTPPALSLYGLSNLSHKETAQVAEIWPSLPAGTRREVISALVDIAETDFETSFCSIFRLALEDEDASVRRAAIEGLWEDDDIRLIPKLAALLEDDAPEVRAAAATSLGRFLLLGELGKIRPKMHQRTYQALLSASTRAEADIEVTRRLLESLAYSEEPEVKRLIDQAYKHSEEAVRISAVFAMGRNGDSRWSAIALRELNSTTPQMRFEAARACGELALAEAVPTLVELTQDTDSEVCEAAIWALGQIGGEDAHRVLSAYTRAESEAIREAAAEALREYELLHGDISSLILPFDYFGELDSDEQEDEDSW
jgi:HEAT repeat protein